MTWRRLAGLFALLACALIIGACGTDESDENGGQSEQPTAEETPQASEFFDPEEYEQQLAWRDVEPEGPADRPWEQMIEPEMNDTSQFASDKDRYNICFSNAAVDNPWRQVGWTTMQAEVDLHDEIGNFRAVDAEASDDKQISDIQGLVNSGNCDALIVSPNTTATLTPAVEEACQADIPVIVFDRGVNTDCPVTFIHPIGGYAYGADAAEFLVENVEPGGKILALRILPGVDVLETRFAAAEQIFADSELDLVGSEFTEGDAANTKSIVADYIAREGQIDGVWMDAGATSVAASEAFEDAGLDIPPITGEDQQDYLTKWQEEDLPWMAPTYPTYQWRTPIIAALKILNGEEVPQEWVLPQPTITDENFDEYYVEGMPPLFYALCGCQEMPGFPERWQ